MARGKILLALILLGFAAASCGKSDSTQNVGYRGYSSGAAGNGADQTISPPSSGTSNGTGSALPGTP
jgi:hypothetical protein